VEALQDQGGPLAFRQLGQCLGQARAPFDGSRLLVRAEGIADQGLAQVAGRFVDGLVEQDLAPVVAGLGALVLDPLQQVVHEHAAQPAVATRLVQLLQLLEAAVGFEKGMGRAGQPLDPRAASACSTREPPEQGAGPDSRVAFRRMNDSSRCTRRVRRIPKRRTRPGRGAGAPAADGSSDLRQ
jgi:hypothetical protein